MKLITATLTALLLTAAVHGGTIKVDVSYHDPETGARWTGTEPVYLLRTPLTDAADDVWVFERNNFLLLLKFVKAHIPKYAGYGVDAFREKWPSIPVATAYPDSQGVATFDDLPSGTYYVVSLAYTRRLHHQNRNYTGSPDRRVLYDYNVWLWDMTLNLNSGTMTVSLNDSNNLMSGYY